MATASGYAADGEAAGSAMTDGGGGGFELNSVTPTAVKNQLDVKAGGIWGSNFPGPRGGLELPQLVVLGAAAAALVVALLLLRKRGS